MFVPSQPRRLSSSETARHKASRVHQQEKELWNSILAEIDLKPDGDLAILLSEIRKRHSELMNCPIVVVLWQLTLIEVNGLTLGIMEVR